MSILSHVDSRPVFDVGHGGIPLKTLADVIDLFPAFSRVLGKSLGELAAKVGAAKG